MSKEPQPVLESVFAFPPSRETMGGTAYLIVGNSGNILIDCPTWNTETQNFLSDHGGINQLVITHRQGISPKTSQIQQAFACPVLIQEQEAYLLPNLSVTSFADSLSLNSDCQLFWTPGFSPGSACLHYRQLGGVLFTGRHILPNSLGQAMPLRTAKTFHWPRQITSLQRLQQQFTPETLAYLCPGAQIGFLRKKGVIEQAYQVLAALDLEQLLQTPISA